MKFLKDLWAEITRQKLIDTQYNEINRLQNLLNEEIDNYNFMKEQFESMQKLKNKYLEDLSRLQLEYDLLKNSLADEDTPELPVDFTKVPYTGTNANTFYNDATNKLETNYTYITISKYFRFWNDEYYSNVIRLYKQKKPKTIRDKVIFAKDIIHEEFMFKYQHDKNYSGVFHEHWKTIPQMWADKKMDCEDFSIMTVATCNIIGVPADRVFMLTGFYGTAGHAFVGFIDDDGITYVLESTSPNSRPIKFKGSKYKCKAPLSGISNWAWKGVPNVEQW